MKRFRRKAMGLVVVGAAAVLVAIGLEYSSAQQPAGEMTTAQTEAVKKIQEQQTTINTNMEAIERKVEKIKEDVRQARIFASRG